jgi:hypothetical protein
MQGRLAQEKRKRYRADLKWDICKYLCQTVSHLSTFLMKPTIGAFLPSTQRVAERCDGVIGDLAQSAIKGRSNNKIQL